MDVILRPAVILDCEGILAVHIAAIRELCAKDYSDTQLLAWSSRLRPEGYVPAIEANLFLVAEYDGRIGGFAEFASSRGEVVAVYVDPKHSRQGVGTLLFRAMERHALEMGIIDLHLSSSLTAVPFYERFGFVAGARKMHRLGDGTEIPCVSMRRVITMQ